MNAARDHVTWLLAFTTRLTWMTDLPLESFTYNNQATSTFSPTRGRCSSADISYTFTLITSTTPTMPRKKAIVQGTKRQSEEETEADVDTKVVILSSGIKVNDLQRMGQSNLSQKGARYNTRTEDYYQLLSIQHEENFTLKQVGHGHRGFLYNFH